jgi:LysM repeat protein
MTNRRTAIYHFARSRFVSLPFPILAALIVAAALAPSLASAQGANLLVNGSFEQGYYKQDGIPELAVPNGWRMYYVDNGTFPGIYPGYVAYRPETVVWHRSQAPEAEQSLFWRDGSYTLKIFKPWAPLYSALMQNVGGLQVGSTYTLAAYIYVDVVDHYAGASKVPPVLDEEHNDDVLLRAGAGRLDGPWRDATAINYSGWITAANRFPFHQSAVVVSHTFRATAPQMSVWIEMMSTIAYLNNGFFVDAISLTGATGVLPAAPPLTARGTPAPDNDLLAGASTYTVRAGDSIAKIAKNVKVPSAAIIAVNKLADPRLIRPGQILIIPDPDRFYTVERGETLSQIAVKYNTTVAVLQALNDLNGTFIYTGQVLVVP